MYVVFEKKLYTMLRLFISIQQNKEEGSMRGHDLTTDSVRKMRFIRANDGVARTIKQQNI